MAAGFGVVGDDAAEAAVVAVRSMLQDGDSDLNAKMEEAEADKDQPAPLDTLWGEISMAEGIAFDNGPVEANQGPEANPEANPSNPRVPRKGKPKV